MATSWVTERKEKENYTKLCRLLYDGGTLAVRTVFDGKWPPASLGATLKTNQHILQMLKKPTGKPPKKRLRSGPPKVLDQHQWDLLYPPSGASPKSDDFDITLLFVLLRNICGLTPPATGWNDLPPSTDTSLEANLVRIKYYRNNVTAHSSKAEVDDTLFEAHWNDISGPLVSLGLKKYDIDKLKSSLLGAKDYKQLVEYWDLSDAEINRHLAAINTAMSEIKIDTSEIKTETSEIKTGTSEIKTGTSEIKTETSEIKTNTSEIKTDTTEIKTDTSEIKTDTSEIKTNIAYLLSNKQNTCTQMESEITKLAHIDFTGVIQRSCKFYHPSTRQWIFNQVEETVQKASSGASVVLIRAGPGMGKSIVAAKLCDIYQRGGFLGGCHFFQHSNSLRNNPRMMLQSIARQLCNSLTGYQAALETKLKTLQERKISDLNCEELFAVLLEEPLSQICIDHNVVIVIDALDECASEFKDEFEDVLKRKLSFLPSWIQFVITTRPLPSCHTLSPVVQIEVDPSDSRNVDDLWMFFIFELAKRNAQNSIEKLMEIASGSFLVAHFVLEILDENEYETVADILECFPHGLSSVYEYYFKRIHELIKPYFHTSDNEDEIFFKMLEAVVATESPIPKELFYDILCLKSENEVHRAKRKERNVAVHLLHTIFPVENDHVSVFHKSVTDWLNLDGENIHQFSVTASNGCEVLVQKSLDVLKAFKKAVKEGEKPFDQPLVLSDIEIFALGFGLEYINESSKLSQSEKYDIIRDSIIIAAVLSCYTDASWFYKLHSLNIRIDSNFFLIINSFILSHSASLVLKHKQIEERVFNNKNVSFGCYLSIVGGLFSTDHELKQKLLPLLIKYKLPYYSLHPVVSSLPSAFQHQRFYDFRGLFKITNGFIAVNAQSDAKSPTSTVLNIKDDGSFGKHRTFSRKLVQGVSPDKKFLIITKTDSSKLELFDVTTLVKVREYNCPINCVDSCHIFGDKQWYIVMKAQGDPKIHILDGLNGQLLDTIEVGENEKIEDVSQCGHILISDNIVISTTVDDDDDDDDDGTLNNVIFLKTVHFKNRDEKIHYYPQEVDKEIDFLNKKFKFSDDGKYFASYSDKKTVYVFHTYNGTLYRMVKNPKLFNSEILFLSSSCLVIRTFGFRYSLLFYDLVISKLIYAAPLTTLPIRSPLLVPPQHHADKSIPRTVFAFNYHDGLELVKYEFHNLE